MKKLHPLLSVLFLISTGFGQNEQSMYDNLFFTKSKHWKVKDFYYTSTKENLKKLTNSNDGIFLEDDTLHIIKNYKFDEVPENSKIFKSMKIYFSDSLLNLKIEGYDNDDINFPYVVKNGEVKIDFSIIDENLNNLIMKISKDSKSPQIGPYTLNLSWSFHRCIFCEEACTRELVFE